MGPTTRKKPTPANVNSGQPVQAPCQTCNKTPCDVDHLWFQVTGNTTEKPTVRNLETEKVRRKERVTDVKDPEVLQLLNNYDLIIDIIADPISRLATDPKSADVEAKAKYHGLSCKPAIHSEIDLVHENGWKQVEQKPPIKNINAAQTQLGPEKFYAHDSFIDEYAGSYEATDSLKDVFGIVMVLIESFKERHVEVRTKSCGVRVEGDPKRPNGALLGLVRVHRNSKFGVELKVPPWGGKSWSRSGSIDVLGKTTTSTSSSTSRAFGSDSHATSSSSSSDGSSSSSRETHYGGLADVRSESRGKDGSYSFSEQDESGGTKLTEKADGTLEEKDLGAAERDKGFDLIITHNGTKVELAGMVKKLIELFQKFVEIIQDIKSLFNAMPQVGWKFTFDISFFEGNFKFEWEPRYIERKMAADRYWPVENLVTVTIGMTIIKISIGASFGIDAKAAGTGLTLTANGSLSLSVALDTTFQLTYEKPQHKVTLTIEAAVNLSVVGNASVAGYTLADAKLSADGGLKFTGEFVVDWQAKERFKVTGKLELKKIELTGHIVVPWWWDKKIDPPILILGGRDLWHFN